MTLHHPDSIYLSDLSDPEILSFIMILQLRRSQFFHIISSIYIYPSRLRKQFNILLRMQVNQYQIFVPTLLYLRNFSMSSPTCLYDCANFQ